LPPLVINTTAAYVKIKTYDKKVQLPKIHASKTDVKIKKKCGIDEKKILPSIFPRM
jgi:hypothetical protein